MTYDRRTVIEDIRQACIADDRAIRDRAIVLKDVLKSVRMDNIEMDRKGNAAVISASGGAAGAARIEFEWPDGTALTDQSDKTLKVISELLRYDL